jgi:hypothetical protein
MDRINKSDLYWAAGFFQGEGYAGISLAKRKIKEDYKYVNIKITQYYDRTPLDKFQSIFGLGTVMGPHFKKRGDQEVYQYAASNSDAETILKYILPILSGKKYDQVNEVLLEIYKYKQKDRPMKKNTKKHCPSGHDYSIVGYINPYGYMVCKTCHAEQKRKLRRNAK